MFDDNKYVTGLKKEKDASKTADQVVYAEQRAGFIKKIKACKTVKDMDAVLADYTIWINALPGGGAVELRSWVEKQKTELKDAK